MEYKNKPYYSCNPHSSPKAKYTSPPEHKPKPTEYMSTHKAVKLSTHVHEYIQSVVPMPGTCVHTKPSTRVHKGAQMKLSGFKVALSASQHYARDKKSGGHKIF